MSLSDDKFKFFVLKGLYLLMRHLVFKQLNTDEILDYRKEILSEGKIDIYYSVQNQGLK